MSQTPPSSTPASPSDPSPPRTRPRRAWFPRVLPFIPIVLALSAAYAYRSYEASQIPVAPELGMIAPDFSLQDLRQTPDAPPLTLSRLVKKGPVILVFHHGIGCHYCFAYLSEFNDQIEDFQRAGLQIVALSSDDTPGSNDAEFHFPLLVDPGDQLALTYGLLDADDTLDYGVFIIDQKRIVRFAARTPAPLEALPDFLALGRQLQHP